ncbi:hypothetical protein Pfo_021756 [Paulownia fortunei]|nr:hypothetical protein Pfo_021756 [Paulownia fortunei]
MSNKKIDSYFKKWNSQDSTSSPNLETSINLDNVASKYQDSIPELSPTKSIWDYPVDKRDEIRRVYLIVGPYQGIPEKSPKYVDKHGRRFLPSWFKLFPNWLEYSTLKNAAYCLPCYLFVKSSTHYGVNAFITDGFKLGKNLNSSQKIAVKHCHNLMNPLQHTEKIIDKQSAELVAKNRLRLKVSIDVARLCAFQGTAFRTHNECLDLHNHGNFLEIMKQTASYNDEVRSVVLENAPQSASYTSPQIQKEILSLYASRIQRFIREEIGDAKYCLIQMAIVLRFVDKEGFIRERFFDVVHVEDIKASTLKREISSVLSRNNLIIQNIQGQEYDGASTMRGEWNGLLALFLNYVIPIEHFFSHLTVIVNLVDSSSKRHDQLHIANAIRIAELTSTNELETRKEKNQIGIIINDKSSLSTKASADGAYDIMTSFEFVFILHFMVELLEMTDDLCRILQYKSQNILNAMDAVANTNELVQKFRENGWDQLFDKVKNMNAPRRLGRGRLHKGNPITLEHHYRIDIFTRIIDSILQEMSYRFDENAVELLRLSLALDPRDGYKSFNINDICKLVEKFYPTNLTSQEKLHIKYQLEFFELDIRYNIYFQNVSTLSELCQYLVDRLIKLTLTLPVSIATTEHAFSSMKFVKTRLRNKMKDDFLASSLLM